MHFNNSRRTPARTPKVAYLLRIYTLYTFYDHPKITVSRIRYLSNLSELLQETEREMDRGIGLATNLVDPSNHRFERSTV